MKSSTHGLVMRKASAIAADRLLVSPHRITSVRCARPSQPSTAAQVWLSCSGRRNSAARFCQLQHIPYPYSSVEQSTKRGQWMGDFWGEAGHFGFLCLRWPSNELLSIGEEQQQILTIPVNVRSWFIFLPSDLNILRITQIGLYVTPTSPACLIWWRLFCPLSGRKCPPTEKQKWQ